MDAKCQKVWRDCVSGDVSAVRKAVDDGVLSPNWTNPKMNDMPLVHVAINYGHDKIVEMLLVKGANPNIKDKNGQTPLIAASSDGQIDIINLLLSKNAEIRARDIDGNTALHKAAKNSHKAVVQLLLENKADIEAQNKNLNTPLHLAAEGGQTLVVKLLLERNAKVNSRNKDGETPLELAEKNKRPCCVDELQKYELERNQQVKDALLWTAVKSGSKKQVSKLLNKGANPNWHNPTNYDYTSVEIAVMYCNIKCLRILIHEGGADPNEGVNNKLALPGLHFAAKESGKEAVEAAKILLDSGAQIDYADPEGQTALHVATSRGHADMVKYLCECGISIDVQDEAGDTAIHIAARLGRAKISQILLRYSANIHLQNKEKRTPLDVANDFGNLIIADELNSSSTDNGKGKEYVNEVGQVILTDQSEKSAQQEQSPEEQILLLKKEITKLRKLYRNVTEQFEDWFKKDDNSSSDELEEAKQKILQLEELLKSNETEAVHSVAIQASYLDFAPEIKGVEVCGETVFEVLPDSLPQNLVWPGYGFSMEIPAGAFPPGVSASVAVRAILKGNFSLPEDSELVSAIYWISCSVKLVKPVAVNIQHCAQISNEKDAKKLKFIIAKDSQVPPYIFSQRDDGVFKAHTQYATIQCKRFSLLGILGLYTFKKTYIALKFLKNIPNSVNMRFRFAVLTKLIVKVNEYKKQMIQEQWRENDDYQHIKFRNGSITLDIPRYPSLIVDNWKIVPMSPMEINEADVQNKSRLDDVLAPCCNVQLQWIGPRNEAVTDLQYSVTIRGTTVRDNFFTISYYPSEAKNEQRMAREQIIEPRRHRLTQQDLVTLLNQLQRVTDYHTLGFQLGLQPHDLEVIERENLSVAAKKVAVLNRWLENDTEAAWEDIVSALNHIGNKAVARYIQEMFCGGGEIHEAEGQEGVRRRRGLHNENTDIVAEPDKTPSQYCYRGLVIIVFAILVVVIGLLWRWFY